MSFLNPTGGVGDVAEGFGVGSLGPLKSLKKKKKKKIRNKI